MPQAATMTQTRFPQVPSPAEWSRPPATRPNIVIPSGRSVPGRDAIHRDPNQALLFTFPMVRQVSDGA